MRDIVIAYCGPAAIPDDLWVRWNADPVIIAALAALSIVIGPGGGANARTDLRTYTKCPSIVGEATIDALHIGPTAV